ncbi:MAG TPA: PilZ domain-containing protein [Acidobacteriaceae bacterium]|nr:PilZ domain-containing protein [Acidobacteriaceae bacterium]
MTQRRYPTDFSICKGGSQAPAAGAAAALQFGVEAVKHCAYNQTRERFLSADVDAADLSAASLDVRLPKLTPDAGAGLWLVPFRGISPTSVRVPVDLVYLDLNCTVVETVESFPLSRLTGAGSENVLVLPGGAIRSTGTRAGDQLILCPPDEMKQRLQRLAASSVAAEAEPPAGPVKVVPMRGNTPRLLQREDRLSPEGSAEANTAQHSIREEPPRELVSSTPEPPKADAAQPLQKSIKPAKNWLQRLLSLDPPDARNTQRESVPGLSAYFFTGGPPVAHGVRDISPTGMYVLTNERWYIGTMVRMTLTDLIEPAAERSITLNASVVRCDDDGVGLKFVLHDGKDRQAGLDRAQIAQFLQRLKSTKGQATPKMM